ncbi:MAG: NAD(P)/FAD-dependent oxidoreductase [Pseudomonadota bacterium]
MAVERIDTLVVGAGQSGLAASAHLSAAGVPHLVLEQGRIAERWRTGRWDSLVANGPAWHDRFPILEFEGVDPNAFAPKERVAAYFEEIARMTDAPVRCGIEVVSARRNPDGPGFRVETSDGIIEAQRIVAATGPFQRPVIPPIVPEDAPVTQLHSAAYRNPDQLPEGGVLVVGSGSSGTQIAEELMEAGRDVTLSVGPHDRPPRRYRGRDNVWWLGVLGKWEVPTIDPATAHVTIAVSGAKGGQNIDFRALAARGMTLVGMTDSYQNGTLTFAPDLAENLAEGDRYLHKLLDECDAWAAANSVDLPEEPELRHVLPDPDCVTDPVRALNLAEAGISTILWATGYALDFGWLQVEAFGPDGRPAHHRGVSTEPGVYFLGLPWLSRRGSSFIWGAWLDAKHIADQIAVQRGYEAFDAECRAGGA